MPGSDHRGSLISDYMVLKERGELSRDWVWTVSTIHSPAQATAVCSWWVSADRRAAARAPASPCKYDIHFWQELIPSSLQCDQNNIYNSIPYSRGYTKYFLQLYMINSPSARCQTSWRFLIFKMFCVSINSTEFYFSPVRLCLAAPLPLT